jgi:hypothetical protein
MEKSHMADNILTTTSDIKKEFSVDPDGKAYVSRRGLARLCGVSHTAINKLVKQIQGGNESLSKSLKRYSGYSFEPGNRIPDFVASSVIKHYARTGREEAIDADDFLGAIGLRAAIQQALNFEPIREKRLTRQEIVELCVLPVPSVWERRFSEDFYTELSRLTGLKAQGNCRPNLWAMRTKELVYDYLPDGIYSAVKQCKSETGGYDKLHQFLSEDGLVILEKHQQQLLTLMQASASLSELKRLLDQSCSKSYQLLLVQ